jgi:hypothetical protein
MVTVPAETPETAPVAALTVALKVLLLYQLPPTVVFVSVVDPPTHTFELPPIAAGFGNTVSVLVE